MLGYIQFLLKRGIKTEDGFFKYTLTDGRICRLAFNVEKVKDPVKVFFQALTVEQKYISKFTLDGLIFNLIAFIASLQCPNRQSLEKSHYGKYFINSSYSNMTTFEFEFQTVKTHCIKCLCFPIENSRGFFNCEGAAEDYYFSLVRDINFFYDVCKTAFED